MVQTQHAKDDHMYTTFSFPVSGFSLLCRGFLRDILADSVLSCNAESARKTSAIINDEYKTI